MKCKAVLFFFCLLFYIPQIAAQGTAYRCVDPETKKVYYRDTECHFDTLMDKMQISKHTVQDGIRAEKERMLRDAPMLKERISNPNLTKRQRRAAIKEYNEHIEKMKKSFGIDSEVVQRESAQRRSMQNAGSNRWGAPQRRWAKPPTQPRQNIKRPNILERTRAGINNDGSKSILRRAREK